MLVTKKKNILATLMTPIFRSSLIFHAIFPGSFQFSPPLRLYFPPHLYSVYLTFISHYLKATATSFRASFIFQFQSHLNVSKRQEIDSNIIVDRKVTNSIRRKRHIASCNPLSPLLGWQRCIDSAVYAGRAIKSNARNLIGFRA